MVEHSHTYIKVYKLNKYTRLNRYTSVLMLIGAKIYSIRERDVKKTIFLIK